MHALGDGLLDGLFRHRRSCIQKANQASTHAQGDSHNDQRLHRTGRRREEEEEKGKGSEGRRESDLWQTSQTHLESASLCWLISPAVMGPSSFKLFAVAVATECVKHNRLTTVLKLNSTEL